MTAREQAPNATLVSHYAEAKVARYPLTADELIIGRSPDAGLVLQDPSVSRRHAQLSWSGSTYVLEDLKSTNGTWVNGRRLARAAALNGGDVIRFGGLTFLYHLDAASAMTIVSAPVSSLVTILFTDMASSTALTQRLGDSAAQEVRRTHNDIVRAALAANNGSEIKHTGDGIMASFATASSALDCAVAIQQGVAAHKQEHPDSPLAVYVGLNAGEPIAEENDLFGTSINLAARICDHAEPNQILTSNVVRELAAGKDFLFSDVGGFEMRGFEDPVRLWELRWREPD